jgi:hypothetical protein
MKLYISRDEDSDNVFLWLKPRKGNWKPETTDKNFINFQRQAMDEIDNYGCYDITDFKTKFGMSINQKKIRFVTLPDALVLDKKLVKFGFFKG